MFGVTDKITVLNYLKKLLFFSLILSSCTVPKKYQQNKPFLFNNKIEVTGGSFSKDQRNSLEQKLYGQLDDSAKVIVRDFLFLRHVVVKPPAYDSAYTAISANNMKGSLLHLGYYQAKDSVKVDTVIHNALKFGWLYVKKEKQERVYVKYIINAGNPTLIDTMSYRLKQPELQQLALDTRPKSFLIKGKPVTKADILGETSRLVELYRNYGYYKFTSDNLKLRGDSTIAALTNVSDDPFESLLLLQEANLKRDKPSIKLAMVLNPAADSLTLSKYYIKDIIIYPDFTPEDINNKSPYNSDTTRSGFIIRYHKKIVRNGLLVRSMAMTKGQEYSQQNYARTLGNFSKLGVWQNTNIQIEELKDSVGRVNMIVQLLPAKKYGFEAAIEASYSANSNTNSASIANAGNLLGLSTNVSLQNRNVGKTGTKMTHAIRAGIELNLNAQAASNSRINSNELSYTNTISFPKLLGPINLFYADKKLISQHTFINVIPAFTNRINLFNQLSATAAFGNEFTSIKHPNRKNLFKFLNIEYSYLYNQTQSFKDTLALNPYLRYSFNTALVIGVLNYGYSSTYINPKKINRQRFFRWNIEESGLLLGRISTFNNLLRQFVKTDAEYTYTVQKAKSSVTLRAFAGVGIPIGKSDTTLPFFKQYFSGGANSMRGWPIRGIGPGSKALAPYNSRTLNDRTGDIRLELNGEYRYDIAQIIPNSLILRGAFFVDAGNVWNFKNTRPGGGTDTLQFNFNRLYKQLGVTAGTGFRFDFNYFLLRFDLGFRFKRPDIAKNDGWQMPNITFNNLFKKGDPISPGSNTFTNRIWRYENFNFTIGLSYPF